VANVVAGVVRVASLAGSVIGEVVKVDSIMVVVGFIVDVASTLVSEVANDANSVTDVAA